MSRSNLTKMNVAGLVERYAHNGIEQDDAILHDDNAKFRRLFSEMRAIETELKDRTGDRRRALLGLFDHPNLQVQLNAAKATLALEPVAARRKIEAIRKEKWAPQGLDAGMTIRALEQGIFKPT